MPQKETVSEFRRRRSIELIEQGERVSLIARLLDVSQQAIYYWYKKYKAGKGIKTASRSGRPVKLKDDQLESLKELLLQGATAHGWTNDIWTANRVAAVIQKHFGVVYAAGSVRRLLNKRLCWTVQRPMQQERERDAAEIQRWKEIKFPQIVKEAFSKGAHLVFVDEAGFMAAPTRRQTYAPRGKTPVIQVTNWHGRISVAGAITVSPKKRHLSFISHALPNNANYCGGTIALFLKEICRHIKGGIVILWDGFSIHLSKPVVQFLEQNPRVRIEPFPAYAHELNPVDKAWLYLKFDCLPNFTPKTLDELRSALLQELDSLRDNSKVLAWCIEQTGLKTKVVEDSV